MVCGNGAAVPPVAAQPPIQPAAQPAAQNPNRIKNALDRIEIEIQDESISAQTLQDRYDGMIGIANNVDNTASERRRARALAVTIR